MSLKLKHLLPIFALALGIGTALLVSRVKAYAADVSNGESTVTISNNDFVVNGYAYDGFASIDFVDQFEDNGVYYSTIGTTSDIYLNVGISTRTPLRGYYLNGAIQFAYKPTVTLTDPSGFTLSGMKYSLALVYSSNENVNCAITYAPANGNYTIRVSFNDFYCFDDNQSIGLTLAFHVTGIAQWSGSAPHRPYSIPLKIAVALSSLTENVSSSTVSYRSLDIKKGIDSSVDIDEIISQLISVNAHMVWTDGSAVYDLADLMWMMNGNQMTGNSIIQSIYNQDTATQGLVQQILSVLTTDSSGVSQSTNTSVSQAHTLEGTAQQSFDQMLDNIGNDNYGGYQTGITYQTGLDSIRIGKSAANRMVADNANSIEFWKRVGDALLDRAQFGSIAAMLMVVLILGFTAWVLKL